MAGPRVLTARSRPPGRGVGTGLLVVLAAGAALFAALLVAAAPTAPIFPLVVVGALAAIACAVLRPLLVVVVGVLAIPLEGLFPGIVGPAQALLGLAAVGWLLRWASTPPVTLPRHPALAAAGALWLANAVGLLFAPEPDFVARQVITWGTFILVAVAIAHTATVRDLRRLLLAIAACGGIAGALAIIDPQPLTGVVYQGGDVNRATGGLGSPNILGILLALTIPVQLVFALRGTSWERVLGASCALLALIGMALAVSRGAFIGLAAALVVLAFWPPFRRAAVVGLPLLAVLALVGSNPTSEIFDSRAIVDRLTEVRETGPNNPRLTLWEKVPEMVADRPIFGMGAYEYGYYTSHYGILSSQGVATHPHSLTFAVAVETGLVGLAALLAMFAALWTSLRRAFRAPALAGGMAYALAASLAGFFVSGILDYALGAAPMSAAFFVIVGTACALTLRVTPTPPDDERVRAASSAHAPPGAEAVDDRALVRA